MVNHKKAAKLSNPVDYTESVVEVSKHPMKATWGSESFENDGKCIQTSSHLNPQENHSALFMSC